jgi:transcriptional regulator with XRE-family HTH domain
MANLRQQVGNLVRYHRKRAKLTQSTLAERTRLSVELINRIERGVAAPSFETLEKLSKVLKTPVKDFFGAGSYSVSARRDDPLQQLLDRISGLDSDDMKWVEGLVSHALKRKVRNS